MSWTAVLGHEGNVAAFASAWKRGRLGHAYLFVGPHGVGKHTFARELAKVVLCENRHDSFNACDECVGCHLVDAGTHPDLFRFQRGEDSLEFKIDVVKEQVLPNLAMKPARGLRKVAILDDADDLNEEAANCFLKTLEEPPPGSLLILVGGPNAETQLPTILSRCQLIRFTPLAPAQTDQVLTAQGITDPVRRQRLLHLAGGSPGQAIAFDDEDVWIFREGLINSLRGGRLVPDELIRIWMEFIENAGKESAAQRGRAALIIRLFVMLLEAALKLSIGASVDGLDANDKQVLQTFGTSLGEERLLAWIERALEADRQIDFRVQLILLMEAFVDSICR